MLCTACDTHNDPGATFCRICGRALAQPAPQSSRPIYATTSAPISGPGCGVCGRTNPAGARFCVYCAAQIDAAPQPSIQPAPRYSMPRSSVVIGPTLTIQPQWTIDPVQLALRAVWFVMIGWWLGLLWSLAAWAFNLTLIGLPLGVTMLNMVPQVMTLRPRSGVQVQQGNVLLTVRPIQQPWLLRAVWFVIIGWWASLVWMLVAWAFCVSLVLMPIAFWMFDRVPTITTLAAE